MRPRTSSLKEVSRAFMKVGEARHGRKKRHAVADMIEIQISFPAACQAERVSHRSEARPRPPLAYGAPTVPAINALRIFAGHLYQEIIRGGADPAQVDAAVHHDPPGSPSLDSHSPKACPCAFAEMPYRWELISRWWRTHAETRPESLHPSSDPRAFHSTPPTSTQVQGLSLDMLAACCRRPTSEHWRELRIGHGR